MASAALAAFRAVALKGTATVPSRTNFMALCPPAGVRLVASGRGDNSGATGLGSHMSDNDPEVISREKERNLTGQTGEHVPGVPGWNEKLASDSEAAVKAEREDVSIEEMVHHSEEVAEELRGKGPRTQRSPHDPSEAPAIKEHLEKERRGSA